MMNMRGWVESTRNVLMPLSFLAKHRPVRILIFYTVTPSDSRIIMILNLFEFFYGLKNYCRLQFII